jgi:ribosomal-protein-alanine N-acetyltransferase
VIAEPATFHPLIRRLGESDLDRIMELELAAYPFPWTRGIFRDCIRVGYECWGLQHDGELIGYSVQNHAVGEAHLLNLCVGPPWQGRGFGSLMLDHTIRVARGKDCQSMFLEVRPSNPSGYRLYERRGFAVVGRRRNYYRSENGKEDAIVMRLLL